MSDALGEHFQTRLDGVERVRCDRQEDQCLDNIRRRCLYRRLATVAATDQGSPGEGEPRWHGLSNLMLIQSLSSSTEFCKWNLRGSSTTRTTLLWSTVTRGYRSPLGCATTRPSRLPMLKRRVR